MAPRRIAGWRDGAGRGPGQFGRRRFLQAGLFGSAGLAAMAVAGCGDDDDDTTPAAAQLTAAPRATTGSSPAAAATTAKPAGSVRLAWNNDGLQLWNPLMYNSGYQVMYREAIADSLIGFEPDGDKFKIVNKLCESVERAPDGLTATFKIRPGARFHDGSPVTSADVKFSYEAIGTQNWQHARKLEWSQTLDHVETPDESTAVVKLKKPYPLLYTYNYQFPIISRAAFDKAGEDGFEQMPIAAGPFKFVSGTKSDHVSLTAVENHYRKTPFIKDYDIAVVKEEGTRVAQLLTGEADIAPIGSQSKPQVVGNEGIRIISIASLPQNLIIADEYVGANTPAADPRVREAISLAIDRKGIVDRILEGEAVLQGSLSYPTVPGYAELPVDPYDPAKARQLLEAAGHGGGFDIDLWTGSNIPEYLNVMVANWKDVGINVKLQVSEGPASTARVYGKETPGIFIISSGADYTDGGMWGIFVASYGGLSYHRYPEIDEQMAIVLNGTDDDARAAAWAEAQRLVHEKRVLQVLWSSNVLVAVGEAVKDWTPIPGIGWVVNMENARV